MQTVANLLGKLIQLHLVGRPHLPFCPTLLVIETAQTGKLVPSDGGMFCLECQWMEC